MSLRPIALIVTALFALKTVAIADSSKSPEQLYAEGQTAYEHADYATAIAKWRASYDLSGEDGLLFNLAQAMRLSGDCANALAAYKKFITLDPAAEQRPLAEDLVRELEPKCGIDGSAQKATDQTEADRLDNSRSRITPVHAPGRSLRVAGLAVGSGGVVSIAVGLYLGHRASELGGEVTAACATSCDWAAWKDKDAAGRRDARLGYLFDGLGVAAIVGGAVMYYLGYRTDRSTIFVEPQKREGGAVVSWSTAW